MRVEISARTHCSYRCGLKKAAWFFRRIESDRPAFICHNVDVISTIDYAAWLQFHTKSTPATLAGKQGDVPLSSFRRTASAVRTASGTRGNPELVTASHAPSTGFSGIHLISPRLLEMMTDRRRSRSLLLSASGSQGKEPRLPSG